MGTCTLPSSFLFSYDPCFLVPEGLRRPPGISFSNFAAFYKIYKTRAKVRVLVIRTRHVAFLMSM